MADTGNPAKGFWLSKSQAIVKKLLLLLCQVVRICLSNCLLNNYVMHIDQCCCQTYSKKVLSAMVKGTPNMGYLYHSSKAQETKQKKQKGRAKGECDGATHSMAIALLNLLHKITTRLAHQQGLVIALLISEDSHQVNGQYGTETHSSVILATVSYPSSCKQP